MYLQTFHLRIKFTVTCIRVAIPLVCTPYIIVHHTYFIGCSIILVILVIINIEHVSRKTKIALQESTISISDVAITTQLQLNIISGYAPVSL